MSETQEPFAFMSSPTEETLDIPVIQRLEAMAVEPGDIVIVTVPVGTAMEYVKHINLMMEWALQGKNAKCIIKHDNVSFSVLRAAEAEDHA